VENVNYTSTSTDIGHKYYKYSKKITPIGLIIFISMGILGTVILSLIYSYVVYYTEYLYVHILLTVVLGTGIGALVCIGGKVGKIRSTFIIGFAAVLFGLFAEYCQLVFWIFIESKGQFLILNPVKIFYIMNYIGSTYSYNMIIFSLYLIDGVLIVATSVIISIRFIKDKAFCERCDRWMKNETLAGLNFVDDIEELKIKLEQGDFSALTLLGKAGKFDFQLTRVVLKHCTQCKEFYLISVSTIKITRSLRGKLKAEEKMVVKDLIIDQHVYNYLMEWNRSLKHSFF